MEENAKSIVALYPRVFFLTESPWSHQITIKPSAVVGTAGNCVFRRFDGFSFTQLYDPNDWADGGKHLGVNESNGPVQVNAAGQVIGTSERFYSSNNTYDLGGDAWFFDGNSTHRLDLSGQLRLCDDGWGRYENTTIAQLNGAGEVIGQSQRFSDTGVFLGWDGWIYNGGPTQEIGLTGLSYSYRPPAGTFPNKAVRRPTHTEK